MAFPDDELDLIVEAYMGADPNADPGTWAAPVDLSSRRLDRPVTITTGRSQGQKSLAAGSASVWLDNDDGELTPMLETSTYYDLWDLGTPMRLSLDNVGASPPYPRFTGFVADITHEFVPGPNSTAISAVKVTISGVVRRLTQGSVAKSAIGHGVGGTNLRGYWPGEDGTLKNALNAGVTPVILNGVTLELIDDAPAGTAGAVRILTAAYLERPQLPIASYTPASGAMTLAFWVRSSAGGTGTVVVEVTGTAASVVFVWNDSGVSWQSGAGLGSAASSATVVNDDEWHLVECVAEENGADLDLSLSVDGVLLDTGSYTGRTLDQMTSVRSLAYITAGGTAPLPFDLMHLAVYDSASPAPVYPAVTALDAYDGEEAAVRIERLANEIGVPNSVTATTSVAMGAQPIADIMALFREAEAVDHGILSESHDAAPWGFAYRSSDERYNLDAALTVDLSTYRTTSGTSSQVLTPVRNDRAIRNEWTVTGGPGGVSATVTDAAHQARHGRYNDSADANVFEDGQVVHDAGWRVREGTPAGLRYQGIPLDLAANNGNEAHAPSDDLITPWLALALGDRVDRTNHGTRHPVGTVSTVVEGYSETLRRKAWTSHGS